MDFCNRPISFVWMPPATSLWSAASELLIASYQLQLLVALVLSAGSVAGSCQ
jgi:hypothetical protein